MKSPLKRRNFTLAITQNIDAFLSLVEQCPQYAWIIHDKDKDTERHAHAYIEFKNPRSFQSVAESLNVAENMVSKVLDKNAILQYLIHKNQPDKFQYKYDEIHANFDLEPFFNSKSNNLWSDYNFLRSKKLSPHEFYELHKHEIDSNSFYQKLRIFEIISNHGETLPPKTTLPPIHSLLK